MKQWSFIIDGKIVGKERVRVGKGHGYTPERTKEFEKDVKTIAKWAGCKPVKGKVEVSLCWVKVKDAEQCHVTIAELSQEEYKPTRRADVDNVVKAIKDALNGVAYVDDKQVVSIIATVHDDVRRD